MTNYLRKSLWVNEAPNSELQSYNRFLCINKAISSLFFKYVNIIKLAKYTDPHNPKSQYMKYIYICKNNLFSNRTLTRLHIFPCSTYNSLVTPLPCFMDRPANKNFSNNELWITFLVQKATQILWGKKEIQDNVEKGALKTTSANGEWPKAKLIKHWITWRPQFIITPRAVEKHWFFSKWYIVQP